MLPLPKKTHAEQKKLPKHFNVADSLNNYMVIINSHQRDSHIKDIPVELENCNAIENIQNTKLGIIYKIIVQNIS